jgi:hypothetical protein
MQTDVFRLTKAITAIAFTNSSNGHLVTLPIGATLRPAGETSLPGFVEVTYERQCYRVFERDLRVRAERYRGAAAAA